MIDFHAPTLADMQWAKPILQRTGYQGCEYTFGNLFMWSGVYQTSIAQHRDFLLAISGSESPSYSFPAGQGDRKDAILALRADAKERGVTFRMHGVTLEEIDWLNENFPNAFAFQARRDDFDYIYSTQSLMDLSGKKYHSKRNHISAFKKTYNWRYEPITQANLEQCAAMNDAWETLNKDKNPDDIAGELRAINHAFHHFFELGFIGGVLYVDDSVVAYTMGEPINDTTFCTHIEKAFASVRGAYPMINNEFAKNALRAYRYVNREEDVGDEGLRKAKLSYQPEILLEKYTAVYTGDMK